MAFPWCTSANIWKGNKNHVFFWIFLDVFPLPKKYMILLVKSFMDQKWDEFWVKKLRPFTEKSSWERITSDAAGDPNLGRRCQVPKKKRADEKI